MGFLDFQNWISFSILTVLFTLLLSTVECIPKNSKATGWMNNVEDEDVNYTHFGGSTRFSKPFVSQAPRNSYYTTNGNTSNKTLAAILMLTVFGLAATALLVILCSKMTKQEQYDSVKGSVY